jgi:hypothetical protein
MKNQNAGQTKMKLRQDKFLSQQQKKYLFNCDKCKHEFINDPDAKIRKNRKIQVLK